MSFSKLFNKFKGHSSEVDVLDKAKDEEPHKKPGIMSTLKNFLIKSSNKISDGIDDIFRFKKRLDEESLDDLEDLLISSDIGAKTALQLREAVSNMKFNDVELNVELIRRKLADEIFNMICVAEEESITLAEDKVNVIVMCGVNGSGKTTTIGKLINKYKSMGKSVMIAACDTFRAAAQEQVGVWADRFDCPVVESEQACADPASVAFNALQRAKDEQYDVLLIDTAGRLQNQTNLMHELSKIGGVVKKFEEHINLYNILVIDATTGQNAHSQIDIFNKYIPISGLVVTKLDSSSKGGAVVSIIDKYKLPIYYVGLGESCDDLHGFDARDFASAIVALDRQEA